MANYLGMTDFLTLLDFILKEHRFGINGHHVKYVRPHFDTRLCVFYGLSLQGMFGQKDFFIVNENRERNLDQWVREFLAKDPNDAGWEPHKN